MPCKLITLLYTIIIRIPNFHTTLITMHYRCVHHYGYELDNAITRINTIQNLMAIALLQN